MLMEEERGLRGQHEADEVYTSALQAVVAAEGADSPLLEDVRLLFDVDTLAHANACQMVRCHLAAEAVTPLRLRRAGPLTLPHPRRPQALAAVSVRQLTHEVTIHDMKINEMPEQVLSQAGELMLSMELVSSRAGKKKYDARRRVVSAPWRRQCE